jgi:hypothetical protein
VREETHLEDNVTNLLLNTLSAVLGEGLLDIAIRAAELLNLLGSTTDEGRRVEQSVELSHDGLEEWCRTNTLDEIVVLALELDGSRGLVRENTNLLVGILARDALLDKSHDDVLTVDVSEELNQQQRKVLT